MGTLALLAAIALVGYLISLRLHPKGPTCKKCKGTGKHHGLIFTYAHRACTRCGGSPTRARLGVRVIHSNGQVWGERKPAEAAAKRQWGR